MLILFNTFAKKKQIFKPSGEVVKIYTCGPTVYDFAHIGNLRAYLFADVLVRYLKFLGYRTRWIMNITDIDDKTINRAREESIPIKEFTQRYEKFFFEDLKKLNIREADFYPRATEHIREIERLINQLVKRGYAYERNGSVYFDVSKFKGYGRLSSINFSGIKYGARVDVDQYDKAAPGDFVLWKKRKPGEPSWMITVNGLKLPGRPGWHIECSAMAIKYLGESLDFHTGGVDLIFPHHENEIAQSEGATGKKFVRFWLHNEHLLVNRQKMAKSLGNFYTLRNLQERGFEPLAFRYLCLQTHYRSKLNFTWKSLKSAQATLKEIQLLGQRFQSIDKQAERLVFAQYKNKIIKALDDDLDTPRALAILHKANNFKLWMLFNEVLGLSLSIKTSIPSEILKLLKERERLRKEMRYKEADEVRRVIKEKGYEVEDTKDGPRILQIPKRTF